MNVWAVSIILTLVDTLNELPARFNAGTTVKYTKSFTDFSAAAGWTLKLHVAGIHKDAIANGVAFNVTLDAADTASLAPGRYPWSEVVTKAGELYTADEGFVVIDPNLITATAASSLDPKQVQLDMYEAAIEALVSGKVASYQIGDRVVQYQDLELLTKIADSLRRQIQQNQYPGVWGPTGQVHFRAPS